MSGHRPSRAGAAAAVALVGTVVGGLALVACERRSAAPAAVASRVGAPRLVVVLVADQMRADYLERFRPVLRDGLKRLLDEGAVFTDAHHWHANTSTAPGHATLASGRFPAHTGIVGNRWFDRASSAQVNAVDDQADGTSPRRLLTDALPDWLRRADPLAKAFTAAGKDRAAVMLGGQRPDAAYWFEGKKGRFTTSRYYRGDTPRWVEEFNRAHGPREFFGQAWEPLPIAADQAAALGVRPLDERPWNRRFPHAVGGLQLALDSNFFEEWEEVPAADEALEEFAEALVENEQLGADTHTDYLGVSFSVLDKVGHTFGPDSPEVLDVVRRLDRVLGRFLAFLDRKVPAAERVIAFSSDHGVVPLPEIREASGARGRRAGRPEIACFEQAGRELGRRHGSDRLFVQGLYLDERTLRERGLDRDALERETAELLAACPGVERVFTAAELGQPAAAGDPVGELFRHAFNRRRSADLLIQWQEFFDTDLGRDAEHGSPWPYDTHVPMIVVAPGIAARSIAERVHTIDLAPTVAALAGLPIPADVDGVDRSGALRAPHVGSASAGKP